MKLAIAVVAAVLLHVVAPQPLEVEIKLKISNGQGELDLGSSLTGQEKPEQPLSSGNMSLEGDKKPKHNKSQHTGRYFPFGGWFG